MNKFLRNTKHKVRNIAAYLRSHGIVPAVGGSVALVTPFAFASGGGGVSFDTASILAAIGVMLAAGIAIFTAYAAGKWTLRAFGLIGGK